MFVRFSNFRDSPHLLAPSVFLFLDPWLEMWGLFFLFNSVLLVNRSPQSKQWEKKQRKNVKGFPPHTLQTKDSHSLDCKKGWLTLAWLLWACRFLTVSNLGHGQPGGKKWGDHHILCPMEIPLTGLQDTKRKFSGGVSVGSCWSLSQETRDFKQTKPVNTLCRFSLWFDFPLRCVCYYTLFRILCSCFI